MEVSDAGEQAPPHSGRQGECPTLERPRQAESTCAGCRGEGEGQHSSAGDPGLCGAILPPMTGGKAELWPWAVSGFSVFVIFSRTLWGMYFLFCNLLEPLVRAIPRWSQ